jgi:hypothetical protein
MALGAVGLEQGFAILGGGLGGIEDYYEKQGYAFQDRMVHDGLGTKKLCQAGWLTLLEADAFAVVPFALGGFFVEEVFHCVIDLGELDIVFAEAISQLLDLETQVGLVVEDNAADFDECAHDSDVHIDGLFGVEDAAEHCNSLFCKGIGEISGSAAARV